MNTINKTLVLASLVALSASAFAYPAFHEGAASKADYGYDIVVDNDGISTAVGTVRSAGKRLDDLFVIQRDLFGDAPWTFTYNSAMGNEDRGVAIANDSSGNFYVCGTRQTPSSARKNNRDIIILKVTPAGLAGTLIYTGPAGGDDVPMDIAVQGGNVYVVGETETTLTGKDAFILRANSTLTSYNIVTYNGSANSDDIFVEVAHDTLGNLYAVGSLTNTVSDKDATIVSTDSSLGLRWSDSYNGPGGGDDYLTGIAINQLGQVFGCGVSDGGSATGSEGLLTRWTTSGGGAIAARFNRAGSLPDGFNDVAATNDSVYACGFGRLSSLDFAITKTTTGLGTIWNTYYDGGVSGLDNAVSIGVAGSEVYVTGNSQAAGPYGYHYDIVTQKYSSGGAIQWNNRYDRTGNADHVSKLVLAANNCWLVGSCESTPTNFDLMMDKRSRVTGSSEW